MALGVEDRVDGFDQFGAGLLALHHRFQAWPGHVALCQDDQHLVHDAGCGGNASEAGLVQHAVTHPEELDLPLKFVKFQHGPSRPAGPNALHFVGFLKVSDDPDSVLARGQGVCALFAAVASRQFPQQLADNVELKVLRNPFVEVVDVCAGLHQKPEWFKGLTCSTPKVKASAIWASRVWAV